MIPPTRERDPLTPLEAALRSEWVPSGVSLVAVPVLSWTWIVAMARDMYGPMTGASAWTMTGTGDMLYVLLLWAMWAVMMTAMMLPSTTPMLLLYGGVVRRSDRGAAGTLIYALAAGYLSVWGLYSVGATALQLLLSSFWLLSPMMELTSGRIGGLLLVVAGIYQLLPVKRECLMACQSPATFLASHWRQGPRGAFQLGWVHGRHCVGCCWALMLLLFVGGVMNLTTIVALTTFVTLERLGLLGRRGSHVAGAGVAVAGVWMLLR